MKALLGGRPTNQSKKNGSNRENGRAKSNGDGCARGNGATKETPWWASESATRIAIAYALGALALLIAAALLARWVSSEHRSYPQRVVLQIKKLIQHASQWGLASIQDDNPLLSLMHVNTAIAYVAAARRMLPAEDIARITGADVDELSRVLDDKQLQAMQRIHQVCPTLLPEGVFAVHSGWMA